jgi:hypothetical protein
VVSASRKLAECVVVGVTTAGRAMVNAREVKCVDRGTSCNCMCDGASREARNG